MSPDKISFGTAGWRGIISADFTFENVEIVSQAIADVLREKYGDSEINIAAGYDSRFLGEEFSKAAACVLAGNGIGVIYSPFDVPTPVISHCVIQKKLQGAVNITASHNPPEYSGIKFSPSTGGPALPETTKNIEKNIKEIQSGSRQLKKTDYSKALKEGLIVEEDFSPPYIEKIKKLVDIELIKSRLSVAYDPMFGVGRHYMKRILGGQLQVINDKRDVLFGGHRPEPAEEYLGGLKKLVAGGADIGIATDGDGDRFGIIDRSGRYITANQLLGLVLYHLHAKGMRGVGVRSVMTSSFMDAVGEMLGVEVIETPVGFKYIGDVFAKQDMIVGGEESGGLTIGGHLPEKDGILACLLAAEIMAASEKTLVELIEEIQKQTGSFETVRKNYTLDEDQVTRLKENLSRAVPGQIGSYKVKEVVTLDGYKFILDAKNTWAGLRFSGTEPVVRLYVESFSPDEIEKISAAAEKEFSLA